MADRHLPHDADQQHEGQHRHAPGGRLRHVDAAEVAHVTEDERYWMTGMKTFEATT